MVLAIACILVLTLIAAIGWMAAACPLGRTLLLAMNSWAEQAPDRARSQ